MRSLLLRPGYSRSTLSGYIVESLSAPPFPIMHRLLATWLQSFATFGTWRRAPLPPHPNRLGTAFLGTHLVNNIISFNGTARGASGGRYGVKRDGKASAGAITLLNNLITGNNGAVNKQSSKDIANYHQVLDGADHSNITTTGAEGVGVSGSSSQSFGDVLLPDYRLSETSIAIDKGTMTFVTPDAEAGKLPEEDKDGNPRPRRATIDLGVFESE